MLCIHHQQLAARDLFETAPAPIDAFAPEQRFGPAAPEALDHRGDYAILYALRRA